jgi:hypothetical protein
MNSRVLHLTYNLPIEINKIRVFDIGKSNLYINDN